MNHEEPELDLEEEELDIRFNSIIEATLGRRVYKEKLSQKLAEDVEEFLRSGGKIKHISSEVSSNLYGTDPAPQTEERLQRLAGGDGRTFIKFCKQAKRWEVRRGSKVIKTLYTLTSAEEYCMSEYERRRRGTIK